MLREDQALSICEEALRRAAADQAEAVLMADDEALTRYANSTIHQNVAGVNATLNLRVALGKRVGVASGNDLSPAGLARLADQALEVARRQPPNHDFPGLPGPAPLPAIPPPDAAVVTCPPERRAEFVLAVIRRARAAGLEAAGAFTTSASELAVANALGLRAYSASSLAHLTAVIVGPDGSGYADATAWSLAGVHAAAVAEEAVERAQRAQGPAEIEPGSYDVVLEPYAVSELLDYLAYVGFSALAVQEGRSFLATSLGQPVASPAITIADDATDPRGLPRACDYEGVPKQRVEIVRQGVAVSPVYDTLTAAREGRCSTGHGLPAPNTFGPFAANLVLAPGDADREQLLSTLERGLWVTRFHYVNPIDPRRTILTGMTRDGTFLVEHGRAARPVKNLRFTQSAIGALANVVALGRDLKLERSWGAGNLVPALAIRAFRFTSGTAY